MRPKSFHAAVVDRLAATIIAGERGAEPQLPTEAELSLAMGVSRTILREAVKTLSAKGLIVTGPRTGTRMRPASEWNLLDPDVIRWRLAAGVDRSFVRDILELRLAIEPEAARLAALRARPEDLSALEAAYSGMAAAVAKGRGHLEADLAFHAAILDATRNQFFAALTPALGALLRVSFRLSAKGYGSARASLAAHRDLADAIAAGRPEAAEAAIRTLIATARQDIEARISADDFLFRDGGRDEAA